MLPTAQQLRRKSVLHTRAVLPGIDLFLPFRALRSCLSDLIMPMVTESKLCPACTDIFRGEESKRRLPQFKEIRYMAHHHTYYQLRGAAQEGCFICAIVWRTIRENDRAAKVDIDGVSPDMDCSISTGMWMDDAVRLEIYYNDPMGRTLNRNGFRLISFEGLLRSSL